MLGARSMPNRSISNLGVRQSSTSISQLLQLPVDIWKTHGDFKSALSFTLILLLVTGSMNRKSAERVKRLYEQAPKPCFVVAIGECALSRGMFIHSYNCPVPVDHVIPVDVYIPGCPPKPEAIIAGVVKLIEKAKGAK